MITRRRFVAIASLAATWLGASAARAATAAASRAGAPTLLVLGDSISSAYGLPAGAGWVDLLGKRLEERGYPQRVVNASIAGDTTAGGRARLPGLIAQYRPAIVIVELGGNDGLRGGDLQATKANLDAIVSLIRRAGAKALVIGNKLPPNYGATYTHEFEALFVEVSHAHKVPAVPYFFAGFGERNDMFQPDRIHPAVAAQAMLLDNVWPTLVPLLGKGR